METSEWDFFKRIEKLEKLAPKLKRIEKLGRRLDRAEKLCVSTFRIVFISMVARPGISSLSARKAKDIVAKLLKEGGLDRDVIEAMQEWMLLVCEHLEELEKKQ